MLTNCLLNLKAFVMSLGLLCVETVVFECCGVVVLLCWSFVC